MCRAKCYFSILAVLSMLPVLTKAADIVNGWSAFATVSKVHSLGAQTLFKLNGITDSCGHPDFWVLPLDETAKSKAKLSMLVAAYMSGKMVSLRCENDTVTDFEIQ